MSFREKISVACSLHAMFLPPSLLYLSDPWSANSRFSPRLFTPLCAWLFPYLSYNKFRSDSSISLTEDRGLILPIFSLVGPYLSYLNMLLIVHSQHSRDRSVLSQFALNYCGISLCRLANFRTRSVYFVLSMSAQISNTNHLFTPFLFSRINKNCFWCVFINIYTINNDALSFLFLQHRLVSVCRIVP